ncbi:MAG: hypothetical protein ACK5HL_02200 [Bacilli bacterium]
MEEFIEKLTYYSFITNYSYKESDTITKQLILLYKESISSYKNKERIKEVGLILLDEIIYKFLTDLIYKNELIKNEIKITTKDLVKFDEKYTHKFNESKNIWI